MINDALSNLQIYFLSLSRIPKGIAKEIDMMQLKFLWIGKENAKPLLLSWEIGSQPKKWKRHIRVIVKRI